MTSNCKNQYVVKSNFYKTMTKSIHSRTKDEDSTSTETEDFDILSSKALESHFIENSEAISCIN